MRTCRLGDFAISTDLRVKLKGEKKDYQTLIGNFKKLWNLKVTMTQLIGALAEGLIKGLEELEVRGRVVVWMVPNNNIIKISQNTKDSWRIEGDVLPLKPQ